MKTAVDFDTYRKLAKDYDFVPVYQQLLSDVLTPVTAFHLLDDGETSAGLFESVVGGDRVGRYSFIAVGPTRTLRAWGSQIEEVLADGTSEDFEHHDPLAVLQDRIGSQSVAEIPGLPPIIGGAIGYAAYDVIRYVENLPNVPPDDRQLPDLDFGFYRTIVVFDNVNKTLFAIYLSRPAEFEAIDDAYKFAVDQVAAITEKLHQPTKVISLQPISLNPRTQLKVTSNFTQEGFCAAVEKCTEYIRAGDIFQVVISQRFEADVDLDPFEVYRSLRVINPSPFMFFLRTKHVTLVGASPEVMCRVMDGRVTVRPLAGTRKRGHDEAEDRRLEEELLADPKERAEHVMLVDLGRNDVGRIARLGSVELHSVMNVEYYSHVMHISSTVQGELASDKNYMDAFKATLPAGTVSGAPKIRAMEIIDEIEPTKRGPYAGAVGYFDYRGNTDTCIALRTLAFCGGKIYIQAGAGIVADSVPELEYQETINKSKATIRAIEATIDRLNAPNG
jgi:anthranilate synthase component I